MVSFLRIERFTAQLAEKVNWISAVSVVFIMLLITVDVTLRLFGSPIPGTYEIVAFMGSMIISFSLPYTSIQKGHIAVEFLGQRFPWLVRVIINIINAFLALVLFAVIAWQCFRYAQILRLSGEVSATLQMPTYPFVYGVSLGCILLCLVLFVELLRQLRGAEIE